jgi:hypothetical protein
VISPSPTLRRLTARTALTASATALCLVVFACSDRDVNLGFGVAGNDGGGGVLITPVEDAAPEAEAKFTLYCPSSECPANRTTCPDSRFRCDVDLLTDTKNCGGCGLACPDTVGTEEYHCVEGRCLMACTGAPPALDCDGIPDNGCEIRDLNNDHCGACGNKCAPDKPCVNRSLFGDFGCGCKPGQILCTFPWTRCVAATVDDNNCGACNVACDPNSHNDAGVPHSTFYFGCYASECGQLKCKPGLANCDGDKENGCETNILTAENCGGCGAACEPGQVCALDDYNNPYCACPAGETFCQAGSVEGVPRGACFNLLSDRANCGACGATCGQSSALSTGICTYGMCSRQCLAGRADCNGNEADDCETNIDADPMNCGACGKVCDAVAGQACVGGACVVKACDAPVEDAGVEIPK